MKYQLSNSSALQKSHRWENVLPRRQGRHLMNVTPTRYYCRNCKFDRTYQTDEQVPSRCPQCQADPKFIIPRVHLPMEDASPEELNGVKVRMQLEDSTSWER